MFRKHFILYHKVPLHVNVSSNKISLRSTVTDNEEIHVTVYAKESDTIDGVADISDDDSVTIPCLKQSVLNYLVLFVSKLYANPTLPRNHVQSIIDDCHELLSNIIANLKSLIFNILKKTTSENIKDKIDEALTIVTEPFQDVSSEYNRLNLFRNMGHYIPPQLYVVGSRIDNNLYQNRIVKKIVEVNAQFVSMRKVLHSFFSIPGVLYKTLDYVKELKTKTDLSNFTKEKYGKKKNQNFLLEKLSCPYFYIMTILR